MNTLSLQALTSDGKACRFSVCDVPVVIDDEQFVLMARPGSPILLTHSIVSCTDIPNISEGTVLTDSSGKEYTVSFKRGFAAMDKQRNVVKINEIGEYRVTNTVSLSSISTCRQRLIYKYGDIQFQLKDFVGIIDGKAVIKENYTAIDVSEIQQYAGLTYMGKNVFLGDMIDGNKVTMHAGRICIDYEEYFIDLADMQIIK